MGMNNLNHHNKGYSLIEVLFVVIIFSVIGLGIIQISNFSWKSYTYNKEQSILQRNRTAIQKITKQIRNALNIMINDSGQEIILKTETANNQFKYYHYLLQNKNLYLQTSNYQPHFKQKKNNLLEDFKLIIDQEIINNSNIFSFTDKQLIALSFDFKKKIAQTDTKEKIKLQQTINRKVYPRQINININLKSQSEVQK